jgi:hypothetical protein
MVLKYYSFIQMHNNSTVYRFAFCYSYTKRQGIGFNLLIRTEKDVNCYHIQQNKKILTLNLLKTKSNLLYIRNQSVPRSKHFPPWL